MITLLQAIGQIRQDFKNDKIISIQDYKEIMYFLNDSKVQNFRKTLATYIKGLCKYNIYILTMTKRSNGTLHVVFKETETEREICYKVKI